MIGASGIKASDAGLIADWAINHGCVPWLEPLGSNVPNRRRGYELATTPRSLVVSATLVGFAINMLPA